MALSRHPFPLAPPLRALIAIPSFLLLWLVGCGQPEEPAALAPIPISGTDAPLLYTIRGVVTIEGGEEATGIMVFCASTSYNAFADAEGNYAITSVPPGRYTLVAQKHDFKTTTLGQVVLDATPGSDLEITMPPVEIPLEAPADGMADGRAASDGYGAIEGTVRLADGETPDSVLARLEDEDLTVYPDESGVFLMPDVAPGTRVVIFELDGYEAVRLSVIVPPNHTARIPRIVTLYPESDDLGDNLAILGSLLFLDPRGQLIEREEAITIKIIENQQTTLSAPDGSFFFDGLSSGQYTLTAIADAYVAKVDVDVALRDESATVVLVLQEKAGVLTGTVDLEGGDPAELAGTQVALPGTGINGITDVSGRFRLSAIPAGDYSLLCLRHLYQSLEVIEIQVEPGEVLDLGTLTMTRDVEFPRVVSTDPNNGAKGVVIKPENTLRVVFSKRMDTRSVREAISIRPPCAFALERVGGDPLDDASQDLFAITIRNGSRSNAPLRFNTRYKVSVDQGATDTEGNGLEEAYSFGFQTGGLTVLRAFPPSNAKNVPVQHQSSLIIHFNGVVDEKTVTNRNVLIDPRPNASSVVRQFRKDSETGWTTYHMPMTWSYDTLYTLRLRAGIRTTDGTSLSPAPYRFRFRTEPQPRLRDR